jgi:hypothetical protein
MTVSGMSRPPLPPDSADVRAEQVLGPKVAKRLDLFRGGGRYVRAGEGARFLAWLVDFVVFVLGVAVGVVVVAVVDDAQNLDGSVVFLCLLALLFLVPLLYGGLCFRNGRALGGVVTGTQVVRFAGGRRLGGTAPWAMLVRTLLMPLLLVAVVFGALAGGGTAPGSITRVAVDTRATRVLHASGIA